MKARVLRGAEVVEKLRSEIVDKIQQLPKQPNLTIVRVGQDPSQLYYEHSCKQILGKLGFDVKSVALAADTTQENFDEIFQQVNDNEQVHSILLLKPLPSHLSDRYASQIVNPKKDVDCFGEKNMLNIYEGDFSHFVPCTVEACMQILKYAKIELQGSRAVVVGYSMVVGKPLALNLIAEGATVKICRTTTKDLSRETRDAEIVVSAIGVPHKLQAADLAQGAVVIDVGINMLDDGSVVGDVDFSQAVEKVGMITPVPGGVGTVTNIILASHVIKAYELQQIK